MRAKDIARRRRCMERDLAMVNRERRKIIGALGELQGQCSHPRMTDSPTLGADGLHCPDCGYHAGKDGS